jgi:glycosyltransferase involved in cell wall biosynthesis
MNVLFVHQNFPGQYRHIAPILAAQSGNRVVALGLTERVDLPGIDYIRYPLSRQPSAQIHPQLQEQEVKFIRGESAALAAWKLREQGFIPDVIYAHPGWGEALFLKDVFPESKLLLFLELFYRSDGYDSGFDHEFEKDQAQPLADRMRLRIKNAHHLVSLEAMDWGISPTHFQWSSLPPEYQVRTSIIFDGIDTDLVRPQPNRNLTLQAKNLTLSGNDKVITFVNRNLEPYRGYHSFMRALPEIQKRHPEAHVLIIGGDEVSYGARPADGRSYKQRFLEEVQDRLDLERIHFLGRVPYDAFLGVLQISSAHIYLTYPFVLSWSMLEAMSTGCLVIGSRTAPVEEVLRDGQNGLLVDFFDREGLANAVDEALSQPEKMLPLREAARQTILERYDLRRVCLPQQLQLIYRLAGLPPQPTPAGG